MLGHGLTTMTAASGPSSLRCPVDGVRPGSRRLAHAGPGYRHAVLRRTLRLGLWLALLAGIGFAVAKLLRGRPSSSTIDLGSRGGSLGSSPDAWPPLDAAARRTDAVGGPGDEQSSTPPAQPATAGDAPAKKTLPPWVAPNDGVCPSTHPIKAKLSSGIFQVEGNAMYQRTNPDRCYQTPEAAAADGLRPAKR